MLSRYFCLRLDSTVSPKLTSRNLSDNTVCCHAGSMYLRGCSNTMHTANTFRGMESPPPSWCIDHKSVAGTNRMMWYLLKLLSEIYDSAQVATKHSSVAFGCSSAAGWLATDWFALMCRYHRQFPQSNCPPPLDCCSNYYNSRSRLSSAVVARLSISFQWELKQVESERESE